MNITDSERVKETAIGVIVKKMGLKVKKYLIIYDTIKQKPNIQ